MNICFTGHRPSKLGGYDWNTEKNKIIMTELEITIIDVIKTKDLKEVHFICGGALGIDQMAFEICHKLKALMQEVVIMIEVAVPFKNQTKAWIDEKDTQRYYSQLKMADKITYVDELEEYKRTKTAIGEYNGYKLQIRNEYMVDNSKLVIAVWDGTEGGTGNCVGYAKKKGTEIITINPSEVIMRARKRMVLSEKKMNLFEVDEKYILAHCISVDHKMGEGIAVEFNKKFKLETKFKILEMNGRKIKIGDAILLDRVFNLITKSVYYGKPTYKTLQMTLDNMKKKCIEKNIKYLAMPKIGCGLDRLLWGKVRSMIEETFKDMEIEIVVCYL